jgi:fatty acid desaturase
MAARALSGEDKRALRGMMRRSTARAFLAIVGDWGVIFLAAALCEAFPSPWTYTLAVVVIARQMNALFELHHHAMHNNLFPQKPWNRRLQAFYSLPLWTTVESDLADHLAHHRTFNTAEKDYLTWGTGYGLDPARRHDRRYMTWFLWLRPFLGPLQLSDLKEFLTAERWRDPAWRRPVLLFWAGAVAALAAAGRLDLLVWYWLVPRLTLFPVLFFWDDMLGHYNCPRTGTREMRGLWFRLFSAHGTNFHNVHHLYPAVPWFNIEKATRLVVDETGVDIARGFVDGMRQLAVAAE